MAERANPVVQEQESLWLKRHIGASVPFFYNNDINGAIDNIEQNHKVIVNEWYYIIVIVIIGVILFCLLNRWNWLIFKRHSRRKRTIGKLRRVIQAIAMRQVPQI